jgi:hypothetical protein
MKKAIKLFVLGGAFILFFGACENDKFEEELPVVKDNVSFELDIQPMLNVQCAGCHNPAGNVEPDFREGYAYESMEDLIDEGDIIPGDAEGSELIEMLEWNSEDGNNMPKATPLSPLNIALIQKWIDEGALNN